MEYKKLKALMVSHGLTQSMVSRSILKINPSTFNNKINGKVDFTISEIEILRKFFNLPYEEIFFRNKVRITRNKFKNAI